MIGEKIQYIDQTRSIYENVKINYEKNKRQKKDMDQESVVVDLN
jgi:hypothetical protein